MIYVKTEPNLRIRRFHNFYKYIIVVLLSTGNTEYAISSAYKKKKKVKLRSDF